MFHALVPKCQIVVRQHGFQRNRKSQIPEQFCLCWGEWVNGSFWESRSSKVRKSWGYPDCSYWYRLLAETGPGPNSKSEKRHLQPKAALRKPIENRRCTFQPTAKKESEPGGKRENPASKTKQNDWAFGWEVVFLYWGNIEKMSTALLCIRWPILRRPQFQVRILAHL